MNGDIIHLEMLPAREAGRQLRANGRYIVSAILVIAAWCLFSAFLANRYQLTDKARTYCDAFYFTVINVTTVGFGDILPITPGGKDLPMANGLLGLLFFGFLIAAITASFQPSGFSGEGTFPAEKVGTLVAQRRPESIGDALAILLDAAKGERAHELHPIRSDGGNVIIEMHLFIHHDSE